MTRPPSRRGAIQFLGFKTSHAEYKRQIQTALGHLAAASGMPTPAEQLAISTAKPKQTRAKPGADGRKLESEVQAEIIKYLLQHPAVAMVERINSGAVYGAEGQFIRFHTIYKPKYIQYSPMRVVDLSVTLTDATRMVIECKREGWSKPSDQREQEQANYLAHIRKCGGIGIFATSTDDVRVALLAAGYGE